MKPPKKGTVRYQAHYFGDKPEIEEWVYRSKRNDSGYMVNKIPNITWVKKSRKHFDYGWADNIPHYCRWRFPLSMGLPFSASKAGAMKKLITDLRKQVAQYGADYIETWDDDPDMEPEEALGIKLKKAITYHKRLVNRSKKN